MVTNKVIWSEGMFLQPHHLQQQERYFENLVQNQLKVTGLPNWGILDYKIDQELLSLGKFGLTHCVGIFPDGTSFNTISEGYNPAPIDIPVSVVNQHVYLALPIKRNDVPDIGCRPEHEFSCPYLSQNIEISDAIVDSNNSTEIQIGRLWTRLMREEEQRGGYITLALAKVKDVLPDKRIILDENFIPPNFNVHAIPVLKNFSKELLSLLYNRGESLAKAQTELGAGGALEVMDFMLLSIINRAEALLQFYISKKIWHPESFYLYLIELLANLSIFYRKSQRIQAHLGYKHDTLQESFDPLIIEVKKALTSLMMHSAIALELEFQGYGRWISRIEGVNLSGPTEFILGIYTTLPSHILCEQINTQVKIAAVDTVDKLITHGLPGIELKPLPIPPREIPMNTGYYYFSLNKEHPLWQEVINLSSIAIQLGTDFPGLKLQFWALLSTSEYRK